MSMDSINRLSDLLKEAGLNKTAEETQKVIKDPVAAQTNIGADMTNAEEEGNPNYDQVATPEGKNMDNMPSQPSNAIPAGSTDDPVNTAANGLKITELMDEPKTAGQKAFGNLSWYINKRASGESVEAIAKQVGVEGGSTDPVYNLNDAPPCDGEETAHPEGPTEDLPAGVKEASMKNIAKIAASLRGINKYAAIRASVHDGLAKAASVGEVGQTGMEFPTGCQTLTKFAAAMNNPAKHGEFMEYMGAIQANPAFQQHLQKIAMIKRAEDVEAVMANQGVGEEQAAAMLDQALAEDPELQQELAAELNGEALGSLADAEVDTAALQEAADEVGVDPEDIAQLAEEIQAIADEAGVEPDEVAETLVEELVGDGSVADDIPAEEPVEKTASFHGVRRTF